MDSATTTSSSCTVPGALHINVTIDSLTVNASDQLTINPAQILTINGPTVTNNGLIEVDNLGSNAAFNVAGNTLLTGAGTLLLYDYSPNAQLLTKPGVTLTQDVNSKIGGVGEIDAALINNGTVNSNYSGHTLVLQTYNMSNNGLFEATGTSTLAITGIAVTQSATAQILSAVGTAVNLTNATINGGKITSAGSGVINTSNANFNNANITTGTQVIIQPGTTLNISGGSLVNNGYIQVDINSQNANLNFTASTSVTGTGNILSVRQQPPPNHQHQHRRSRHVFGRSNHLR